MSNLPVPEGLKTTLDYRLANRLHSFAIHLLRDAKKRDIETALTPQRLSLLSILVYSGDKTINQLAKLEQVSAPAITRNINSLEKKGYIRKTRDKQDKRVVLVSPTQKSRNVLEFARKARIERITSILERLEPAKQQELLRLVNILSDSSI